MDWITKKTGPFVDYVSGPYTITSNSRGDHFDTWFTAPLGSSFMLSRDGRLDLAKTACENHAARLAGDGK